MGPAWLIAPMDCASADRADLIRMIQINSNRVKSRQIEMISRDNQRFDRQSCQRNFNDT